ncbi:mitotic spindle checkpoint protein Bub3 [Yamadazyma tenuis]|uniref:Uncharacterized protein n=1 Tax=Candida tenuis (strain ATCC 10573 / BCRC 21748 / CBS 615 / JCM 9827 / NBRC 10315 / NRRL Y-1498 / VKM Y-70) TaxID=590646 RepID=G3B6H2_CANTC|nr:uncharacterized protein CANTEDRAFT_123778 [Yamadazyma tenuis ATCC 10573]EGV63466.1 hypothetical protein CANTEDRAFT_123778 [Yamadazyma tenuis ATCC 10573]WEJ96708.1 mitotic spindle checkpoint protein Bub3 [Yamadazyma tenuis]
MTILDSEPFIRVDVPKHLDIISDLKFSKSQDQFLFSSWNNKLLLYDCSFLDNTRILNEFITPVPILSIQYLRDTLAYVGSLDGSLYHVDYENGKLMKESFVPAPQTELDSGINNLATFNDSLLVASTFNKHFHIVDSRTSHPIVSRKMEKKILNMDTTSTYLAIGMTERTVEVYDHRNWNTPFQVRESGLKSQITDLKTFPSGEGFAISSIDGRVSVEYFDPSPAIQDKKYAFKCHRLLDKLTQTDVVYPVNSILFNRKSNHLYTSGSDGCLNLWNWETRRRVKQFPKFKTDELVESIVKLDLNCSQSVLAVATSDDGFKNSPSLEQTGSSPRFSSCIYVKRV